MKDAENYSSGRCFAPVSAQNNKKVKTKSLSDIERLEKTNAIWIQPDYTRNDVEKILQQFEAGIFIVRMNSEKTMVLSYRTDEDVQHIRIKKDLNGINMEGSMISFENINEMISHYMTHSIQSFDLFLKFPRALQEAFDNNHFKFFVKMNGDFWKTSLPNKSINEIFLNSLKRESKEPYVCSIYNEIEDFELTPTVSLKDINDFHSKNSLAYEMDYDKRSTWRCPIWICFFWKCKSISQADVKITHHCDKDFRAMSDKNKNFI